MSKRDAPAAGSGGQAIPGVSESEGIRDISEAGLTDFEPEEATPLTGYTAVSEGQRQHIDYLLSTVDNDLAWVALVVVKEYGLPSKEQYAEYMAQFAGSGLDDESDRLAIELLDEVRRSDWDDFLAQADSAPVETTAQDLADNTREEPSIGIEVSGILRVYKQETFAPGVDSPHMTYEFSDTPAQFRYLRTSDSGNAAYLIEIDNEEYWIDTFDPDAEFDLVPFVENGDQYTHTTKQVVANGYSTDYERQSIVPGEDTGTEDVEISHRVYADRTLSQLGTLTRDYNTRTNTVFEVQSPVIGPDVRVELVIRAESNPESSLGNYVVISFPASVYLSDPEIMHQLEMQNLASQRLWNRSLANHLTEDERARMQRMSRLTEHNPERWQEDGRIMIAYAHLSRIEPHIAPGQVINDADKSLIGITGNTGKDIKYHHLDLLELYIGSSEPGSGALGSVLDPLRRKYVDENSQSVEHFFSLAAASQLFPNGNSILYIENLDTARTHPELDSFRLAQYLTKEGNPNDSIYFEDE